MRPFESTSIEEVTVPSGNVKLKPSGRPAAIESSVRPSGPPMLVSKQGACANAEERRKDVAKADASRVHLVMRVSEMKCRTERDLGRRGSVWRVAAGTPIGAPRSTRGS
jgi:hypothetical protein